MVLERERVGVTGELLAEIQRFLADEAALLDEGRFDDWFPLLAEDVSYKVTAQLFRDSEDGPQVVDIVDEDRAMLKLRVDQLAGPRLTRAENPPSLYRRFVSNVRAEHGPDADSYVVRSNLLVYKNRPSTGRTDLYAGSRRDVLRRVGGGLRIAARTVSLDCSVLAGGTLSALL